MTKARKILISSLLLTTVISTTTITAASCSLLARKNQPIPISQPNPTPKNITNQQDTKTQTETKKTYDPNLFTFDKITFKIAKEDNDKDLKEQKFLDEIKEENQLEKYVPKKDDFYYKKIGFGPREWFWYPTLAKASVYINHHEPIFTNKGFKLDHLQSMLNTLKNNSQWSVEELEKEADFRRQHLFFLELKKGLDEGENYLDNIPDRLGKYHRKELPPEPTEDDGFGVRRAYKEAVEARKNQAEYFDIRKWTEEDRWNYWKIGDKPLGTMLWYFNRVIYGSDEWNTKFQKSNHNNELFLSKLFYEKTLTKDQRQYWDMDFIMYNFMNQSSLLMSTGEQYDLYKAYLEYLVQLANLNLHQIQEKTENNKTVSKEEQYLKKLGTTIGKLEKLEELALKTLQANHILGFSGQHILILIFNYLQVIHI